MIDQEIINSLKEKVPLSKIIGRTVLLKPKGQGLAGLCPFHKEKTPSFYVRDKEGRFKCFGCGVSGDVFEFIMRLRGVGFNEACEEVALLLGVTLGKFSRGNKIIPEEQKLLTIQEKSQVFFTYYLGSHKNAIKAREYLIKDRGLTPSMIKEAGIGFGGIDSNEFLSFLKKERISEEDALRAGVLKQGKYSLLPHFSLRITFPIKDFNGKLVAFGGRILIEDENSPKYINSHSYSLYEKRKTLFGLFESKKAILQGKTLHLVEGYFDALALWAIGIPAAALCGSSLSHEHVLLIKRLTNKLILVYDADTAGINALKNSLPLLFLENIQAKTVRLTKKDPGDYLAKADLIGLKSDLEKSYDALCYLIDNIGHKQSIQDRLSKIDEILPIFKSISRPIVLRQYSSYLAKSLHEDTNIIWQEILIKTKGRKIKSSLKEPKRFILKLNGIEQLLVNILKWHPHLLKDFVLSEDLSQTVRFIEFFNACSKKANPDLRKEAQNISLEFLNAIELVLGEAIEMTEEMARDILQSLKNKQDRLSTKSMLHKKRYELKKAESDQDFLSIKQNLKEQSKLLKIAHNKDYVEQIPLKKNPKKEKLEEEKNNKNKPLVKEWQIFDDEESWY